MINARLLVLVIAAIFLFFIGESFSGKTEICSKYPHGVVSHERDWVMEKAFSPSFDGDTILQTSFADRRCAEMEQGILLLGSLSGAM